MTTLDVPSQDEFEDRYTAKLREMLAGHGIIVQYERDRAGIDLGLHLEKTDATGAKKVTTAKVWFQLKGVHSATLPLQAFDCGNRTCRRTARSPAILVRLTRSHLPDAVCRECRYLSG